MKRILAIVAAAGVILAAGILFAGAQLFGPVTPGVTAVAAPLVLEGNSKSIQSVTLKVDGMWCASCSYIVRQALLQTPGVMLAEVSSLLGKAEVMYDTSKSSAADLIAATEQYGYPSEVIAQLFPPSTPALPPTPALN